MTHYRQGDLLIIRTNTLPERDLKKREDDVLQEGELTGHKHILLDGDVYEDAEGNIWLHAEKNAEVIHDEHDTIPLAEGDYEVRRQRDFSGQIAD